MSGPPTLVLLFTTFPVVTETFLQREVDALNEDGARLELWSLWRGRDSFAGLPVRRPSRLGWIRLFWWLPYWIFRRPRTLAALVRTFLRPPPNPVNTGENLLGLGLGLIYAEEFSRREDPFVLHAVWASLPATFGWVVSRLTGCPFTMAAHAYDLFEDGGDWILPEKCRSASWIRTSTEAGAARLREVGAPAGRVSMIRRGLFQMPPMRDSHAGAERKSVRLLSVGRLVPKMGYLLQVEVYRELRDRGFDFEAEIIGEGPERAALQGAVAKYRLASHVRLSGAQPYSAVEAALHQADVALFTGVVAVSGDQAGFPNYIGEAMAAGVPVVTTAVGAVGEAVKHGETGLVASTAESLADAIVATSTQPSAAVARTLEARRWVEIHFDARRNMRDFRTRLEAAGPIADERWQG